jgi:autotransporter-associated beta strand protein
MILGRRTGFIFCIVTASLFLYPTKPAIGAIYQWEWIDPVHPELGKQQSTTLCPGGENVNAEPGAWLTDRNLTQAYLINANMANATCYNTIFTDADLSHANLSGARLDGAFLTDTNLTDAIVKGTNFNGTTSQGFTADQLYSTESYKSKDLGGMGLFCNVMDGWNFTYQNLTGADLTSASLIFANFIGANLSRASADSTALISADLRVANLTGANLSGAILSDANLDQANLTRTNLSYSTLAYTNMTDAVIQGANLSWTTNGGFNSAQLYSTYSYKTGNLSGIGLDYVNMDGWNFAGQNLTGASFHTARVNGANFSGVNLTSVGFHSAYLSGANLMGAEIQGANFDATVVWGFARGQLYSTASYMEGNLRGISLNYNDLTSWNFSSQDLSYASFYNSTLTRVNFSQAVLAGANFNGSTLNIANLSQTDLSGATFTSSTLTGANLSQANLLGANFNSADLTGANLSQSNLISANFTSSILLNATISDAVVQGASFANTTLQGFTAEQLYSTASYKIKNLAEINLSGNDLSEWNFSSQNLAGANLSYTALNNTNFSGAIVQGANFSNTTGPNSGGVVILGLDGIIIPTPGGVTPGGFSMWQLSSTASYQAWNLAGIDLSRNDLTAWQFGNLNLAAAKFNNTNLTDASFYQANLSGADFSNASLNNAYFYRANLTEASLNFASMTNAFLFQANLTGANLSDAMLDGTDFTDAVVQRADFSYTWNFTAGQLYSTASYKSGDLTGIRLGSKILTGWNFADQNLSDAYFYDSTLNNVDFNRANLTNAYFDYARLTDTNMTDTWVQGASFGSTTWQGFVADQLYSTASYKAKNLAGISLNYNDLTGWGFADQNLTSARFLSATLYNANFSHADLTDADLSNSTLIDANFSHANLTNASLGYTMLTEANMTDALVQGANFGNTTGNGFTAAQLYSTASYKTKNLVAIYLADNNLGGWNFSNQNLTGASFAYSSLSGANFTDTIVLGVDFTAPWYQPGFIGLTSAQLYSTASYKAKDLTGIKLAILDLTGWNFANQNMTGASFTSATLTGANFTDALVQGANFNSSMFPSGWGFGKGLSSAQLYSTASYKAKSLSGIGLAGLDLSGWNFAGQNLTNASLGSSNLAGADLTDAIIKGVDFGGNMTIIIPMQPGAILFPPVATTGTLSSSQLYSTASYKVKDLSGINLANHDLSNWDLHEQNLINVYFSTATLTGAIFTNAIIRGANFSGAQDFTFAQLQSTASYQAKDLSGIGLGGINLDLWDFHGQNLTNASFDTSLYNSWNVDLTGADIRGAGIQLNRAITTNTIRADGTILGLDLSEGRTLLVRDYDGSPPFDGHNIILNSHGPIPITVKYGMNMGEDGTLQMVFGNNSWGSKISFAPGIQVALGGTLNLTFTDGATIKDQLGRAFSLFDWLGVSPAGTFNNITSAHEWDLSKLYSSGEVALLAPHLANTSWTGTNNSKWNDPANWSAGVPTPGCVIKFDASAPSHQPILQNISSKLSLNGITFSSDAGEHILAGPALKLQGDVPTIASASASDQFIANPLELAADATFNLTGSGAITLGGEVYGIGSLIKRGPGKLILANIATNTGQTIIEEGILALDATGQIETDVITNNAHFQILEDTHTVGTITGNGSTEVISGSLTATSLHQNVLTISAGAKLVIAPLGGGPLAGSLKTVPEPTAIVLLGVSMLCLLAYRRLIS